MKKINMTHIRNLRNSRNEDLIKRMHEGESLSSFNSFASWFPERPTVKKSSKDIERLYGESGRSVTETSDRTAEVVKKRSI